jgi:ABC-type lipoprotein release transport system permease subunit
MVNKMLVRNIFSLRYLRKRKKQNVALFCAITIGGAIFLAVSSILGSWADVVLSKTIDLSIGHLAIFPSSGQSIHRKLPENCE